MHGIAEFAVSWVEQWELVEMTDNLGGPDWSCTWDQIQFMSRVCRSTRLIFRSRSSVVGQVGYAIEHLNCSSRDSSVSTPHSGAHARGIADGAGRAVTHAWVVRISIVIPGAAIALSDQRKACAWVMR